MVLFAEAKLSNRIAVVPKFVLGANHNNGTCLESYLIGVYFSTNRIDVEYILEEEFKSIKEDLGPGDILVVSLERFDYDSDQILVERHMDEDNFYDLKLPDVLNLAKLYHGLGVKFVIPQVTATEHIKSIGNIILDRLEKPIVGLHLRRGDRLNRKLDSSMKGITIQRKLDKFEYKSVYYCTKDKHFSIENKKYYSHLSFSDVLGSIEDNFLLFCIEMYVVDNCNISVRTFNDSSPFYYIEDKSNKNYALCNYSMVGSDYRFKNIPKKLVKCYYEDEQKINRNTFTKSKPLIPWMVKVLKNRLRVLLNKKD